MGKNNTKQTGATALNHIKPHPHRYQKKISSQITWEIHLCKIEHSHMKKHQIPYPEKSLEYPNPNQNCLSISTGNFWKLLQPPPARCLTTIWITWATAPPHCRQTKYGLDPYRSCILTTVVTTLPDRILRIPLRHVN